ncbi:class I SAM-dependent methyltransferase [Anaerocolumna xylanovorans]|uniref:Methyltransferase domain-containing protein n=1 Tax=Anaerocolumna xylanovorans DSM 12503 TaxID=1121345 RepID=A0A1M7YN56_9FIRM|nr:class I SAM-dependent methyltransferase [Anaerocolumna xylanovorans]SHO54064.1 Methyltransferase domain-containing protein [Anaerocolumna xylanovorans DSM 12503]
MEYMGNKEYWDEKFANRSDNPLSPEESVTENIEYFKTGTVLDIACGDGRNTLYLLERGFGVTGVDFSCKALERLNMFAKRKGYPVNTRQIDLSVKDSLAALGIFDNILINHYRPDKQQLREVESHIADYGLLFISGFGHKHKADSKIKEEDLIQPTDFKDMEKSFELIKYTENQDDRGFLLLIFSVKEIHINPHAFCRLASRLPAICGAAQMERENCFSNFRIRFHIQAEFPVPL